MALQNNNIILTEKYNQSDIDDIIISAKELKHDDRIYKKYNLLPEGQKKVTAELVLQSGKLIRYYIKELDCLLKLDGIFNVVLVDSQSHGGYFRSREQVKYEFSLATNGRYCLISSENKNGIIILKYQKIFPTLSQTDKISKWSFGIISNGQKNDWVLELIDSIRKQKIPDYEILICGPSPYKNDKKPIDNSVCILDDIIIDDIRAPISHKKNSIIKSAKYNNLCVMHDRFLLPNNWYSNFENYGNYFDVLCLKNISQENKRIPVDWMKFHYPLSGLFRNDRILAYDEWDKDLIIQGGIFIIKKNLIISFMLDERLYWGELEDMQLSKLAYLNGLLISLDTNNYFISRSVRHQGKQLSNYYLKYGVYYYWLRGLLSNYLKYRNTINKYYSDE